MKQMEVTIMGQSYLLGCPEGGEVALTKAVSQVDKEMNAIRDAGRVKARERIAVLAALNLAYQLAEGGPAPRSAVSAGGVDAGIDGAAVDKLVMRLDDALGQDGQLL